VKVGSPKQRITKIQWGNAMSWDVFVLNLPPGIRSLDDIPKNYEPPPLGTRANLIAKIKTVYPQTDFSDPSWGTRNCRNAGSNSAWARTSKSRASPCMCGAANMPPKSSRTCLDALEVRAIDPNSKNGIFADQDSLRESFARWGGFRAQVDKMINGDR
jgi:hypothetical protein